MATEPYRLPTHVRPIHYDTTITCDPAKPIFEGRCLLHVQIDEPVQQIVLHARGIESITARLHDSDDGALAVTMQEARETITLTSKTPLGPGAALVELEWTGNVARNMQGLYLSKDGDEVCLATQCEATDARAILPCFDEPAFKATFAWTIVCPDEHIALANGALEKKEENGNGTTTWRFASTPRMSSYLAAFAVGPFSATPTLTARDVPFRVWALSDKQRLGTHANELATRLAAWYEDYFDTPYPFSHYDQIAVPAFSFGAMENPGLVVFRASLLLMDPNTVSWPQRKQIDLVVAHEFAHMWFGNLVTMAWWDDLWLNEAFAEWLAHKAIDELEPGHEVWYPFQDRATGAMHTDTLTGSHAIYHPVKTPEEAQEMFDAITYGKGSAVMRMLEAYLGPEAFRAGLRTYMTEFAHDNAQGGDLWRHLGTASDEPVDAIMQSWVRQAGHPVVHVALKTSDGNTVVHVRQERARATPDADPGDQTWMIPIVLRYEDDAGTHQHRALVTEREQKITIDTTGGLRWLHANGDDVGVFRVAPDAPLLEDLLANYGALRPTERRGVLRDQWALVRMGAPVQPYLDLLSRAVRDEDHYAAVAQVVGSLRGIEQIIEHAGPDADAALHNFRRWVAACYETRRDQSGVAPAADEEPSVGQLRAHYLRATASIGRHAPAIDACRSLAATERTDPSAVAADIAGLAIATTAANGDASTFEAHVATYVERRDGHASPQEVDRYQYTLGSFRDPDLVDRTLALFTDDVVPNQSIGPLLRMMLGEPHTCHKAWAWVKERWDKVKGELGEAWLGILVESAGDLPPQLADDVVAFFDANLDGHAPEAYKRAKESLANRAELYGRITGELVAWATTLEA